MEKHTGWALKWKGRIVASTVYPTAAGAWRRARGVLGMPVARVKNGGGEIVPVVIQETKKQKHEIDT